MSDFKPEKPEKKIKVEITAREAYLLKKLRKCSFGKVIVHKMNGLLIRVESTESQLINEEDGLDLAVE